ncbi:MAG: hypothetical protein IJB31_07370 [Akkermansia sp.]|nr:hypothetical protein [Akkermansia sp.]
MSSPSHSRERRRCLLITLWGLLWILSFLMWYMLFYPAFIWVAEFFNIPQS